MYGRIEPCVTEETCPSPRSQAANISSRIVSRLGGGFEGFFIDVTAPEKWSANHTFNDYFVFDFLTSLSGVYPSNFSLGIYSDNDNWVNIIGRRRKMPFDGLKLWLFHGNHSKVRRLLKRKDIAFTELARFFLSSGSGT